MKMYILLLARCGEGKSFFLQCLLFLNCHQLKIILVPKWHILVPSVKKWLPEVEFILLNFTIRVWFFPKPQLSSEKTWLFPLYFHLENVKLTDFLQMLLCCLLLHLIICHFY